MVRELLPTCARPVNYALSLQPDLVNFTFAGKLCIEVEVVEATKVLTLNSREIRIEADGVGVVLADKRELKVNKVEFDEGTHRVAFHVDDDIAPQTIQLNIVFEGVLNDKMCGFYRSAYKVGEETRYMATTQFEAVDARRAFPCWDEPAHKATFDITLIVPEDRVALSNMDAVSTTASDGLKTVVFRRTPKMSTYLVAFIVGEFEAIECRTKSDLPVRVWTPVGKKHEGEFALSVASRTLDFYTEYFDIPYPLPKMDMVAIPDFAAGAMENWGLVTYRSVLLLYNPKTTPASLKQKIAYVVGHELAHQWFGNLVTMEWWTDLWLNEAFATWVGWRATDYLFPDWKVWEQFLVGEFGRGQKLDALRSSHPIEVEVNKAEEVDEIFDAISYSKGASVLRMLVGWLGEDSFKLGLREYLKKHQYANTRTVDLWEALSASSGKDVAALMAGWTQQMGFPVVRAGIKEGKVVVSQSRYLSAGNDEEDKSRWVVPLLAANNHTGPANAVPDMLEGDSGELSVPVPASDTDWLKLNLFQTGFYRVQYDAELLPFVARASQHLSASDRCGLVSDAFALAAAGYASTTTFLELLKVFRDETSFVVWNTISDNLSTLMSVWGDESPEVVGQFRAYVRDLVVPAALRLGWDAKEGEPDLVVMLRSMLVGKAAILGDPAFLAEARRRFGLYVGGDDNAIQPDMRAAVIRAVLRHGTEADLEHVFALYRKTESQDQRVLLLGALGAVATPELVTKVLEFAVSGEVRNQDLYIPAGACAASTVGRHATWKFVSANWERFFGKLEGTAMLLGRAVQMVSEVFTSEEMASEIEAFFTLHQSPAIARSVQQALESVRARAKWLERDREAVRAFLASA